MSECRQHRNALKPYDFNRNSGITEPEIISFSRNTALLTAKLTQQRPSFIFMSQKQVLGRHSPKSRLISMKFDRDQLLHGAHLSVQFDPDRCMGGSRPTENDLFFPVIPKMHHNSSYIQRISTLSVANPQLCETLLL